MTRAVQGNGLFHLAWKCPLLSAVFLLLRGRSYFQPLLLIYSFIYFSHGTTEAIVVAEACVCFFFFFTEASAEMNPPSTSIIFLPYKEWTCGCDIIFF